MAIAAAVVTSAIFLVRRSSRLRDYILAVWLILLVFALGMIAFHESAAMSEESIPFFLKFKSYPLAYGPLFFLYMAALANPAFRLRSSVLLHFLPFVLFSVLQLSLPSLFTSPGAIRAGGGALSEHYVPNDGSAAQSQRATVQGRDYPLPGEPAAADRPGPATAVRGSSAGGKTTMDWVLSALVVCSVIGYSIAASSAHRRRRNAPRGEPDARRKEPDPHRDLMLYGLAALLIGTFVTPFVMELAASASSASLFQAREVHLGFFVLLTAALIVVGLREHLHDAGSMPPVEGRMAVVQAQPRGRLTESSIAAWFPAVEDEATADDAPGITEAVDGAPQDEGHNAAKYLRSGLKVEQIEPLKERLERHMKENKPYLDSNLKMETLAQQVNLQKSYLTQVLNEGLGKNFYQYVNEYRIDEAKRRLVDGDGGASILDIAYDCGFNSKATFNLAFKKFTGMTPSEYRGRELAAEEP